MDRDEIKQWYAAAVELLNDRGYEAEFREDYSGRGMFGDCVPAIVTSASGTLVGWALCQAAPDPEVARETRLLPARSDNMGMGMVYY